MSAYSDTHEPEAISRNLGTAYELGLIAEDEIVCELEGATSNADPGLLVVTDLNVVFAYRSLSGKSRGFAIPLEEIVEASASERRWIVKARGCLHIAASGRNLSAAQRDRAIQHTGIGAFADLLGAGEIPLAFEDNVWLGWRWGRLLITDRRLGFLMGGILWPRRFVISLPHTQLMGSSAGDDPEATHEAALIVHTRHEVDGKYAFTFGLSSGARGADLERLVDALAKVNGNEDVPYERVQFDCVGDLDRARQIASTISRQKEFLDRRSTASRSTSGSRELAEIEPLEIEPPPVRVTLGRGVVRWVNARGGRLYVWGDPFSEAFEVMKASSEPPRGVAFEPWPDVNEIEVYLESEMTFPRPMHIGRRWFGLGPGLTVNTGFVETGGI